MRVATAFTLLLVTTLFGCLHDEDDELSMALAAGLPPDQIMGGVWEGVDSDGIGYLLTATEDGRLNSLSEIGEQGFGSGSVNGSDVTAAYSLVPPFGSTLFDGSTSASCTATGTIEERQTLDLTKSCTTDLGTNFSVTVELTYNSIYELDSDRSVVEGIWDDLGAVLVIRATGEIFEQDGCVFNGQIDPIDTEFNLYEVGLTASNCMGPLADLNGSVFSGVGIFDNTEPVDFQLWFATGEVQGTTVGILFELERL